MNNSATDNIKITPMTQEQLDEIRQRFKDYEDEPVTFSTIDNVFCLCDEVSGLLAEIERLQAENKELQGRRTGRFHKI